MNILLFIVVLSVLVFVHELGHFLFAKMTKTKVHSFAIGFQPTLLKKKIGETTYKLNLIPFGGYVRIHGQDPEEEITEDLDRAYYTKPVWAKLGILIGGVFFNIVFAWILISAALSIGTPVVATDENRAELTNISNRILTVQTGSAGSDAGLEPGMQVESVTFQGIDYEKPNTEALIELVKIDPTGVFTFNVLDSNEPKSISVTPEPVIGSDLPKLGLAVENIGDKKIPFHKALVRGIKDTREMSNETVKAFIGLIKDAVSGGADVSTLTGPVGLVGHVGDAASYGLAFLLFFTALISINLAVLNMIPFPALDGGQILFVLIEAVIRRPINPKVARWLNMAGFALLMLLMVSVTVFDIVKIL